MSTGLEGVEERDKCRILETFFLTATYMILVSGADLGLMTIMLFYGDPNPVL